MTTITPVALTSRVFQWCRAQKCRMGTISLKATPINQDGNFRTFRQARGFLGVFAGEYPRHFYSTLTEPERDTGKARDQNVLFIE